MRRRRRWAERMIHTYRGQAKKPMVIDDIKEWPSHDEVEMDCQVEALLAIAFGFSDVPKKATA